MDAISEYLKSKCMLLSLNTNKVNIEDGKVRSVAYTVCIVLLMLGSSVNMIAFLLSKHCVVASKKLCVYREKQAVFCSVQ